MSLTLAYRASQKTQKNKKESSKGSKTANGTAPSSDTNKKQKEGSDSGSDVELVDEPWFKLWKNKINFKSQKNQSYPLSI